MRIKKLLLVSSILLGTIIGAGIFGIPYAIKGSGLIPGFFYFLILGGAILLIHLLFGEVILRTREKHRLPGYAKKYLGNKGRILITISTIVGLAGTLLAYIIIGGDFLKLIFSSFLNLPSFYFSLIFWFILAFFIFRGIKLIARAELLMNIALFSVIFLLIFLVLPKFNLQNFSIINLKGIFLPYGIILFSLIGYPAIPIIAEILKKPEEKKGLKKIIILVISIVIVLYFLFTISIIGVSGNNTTPEAFQGLIPYLNQNIVILGALFGVLAISTSFLVLGNYFKNTLFYDYKIPRQFSALIACGLPLILFLIGFRNFIETIGLVGTFIGAIEGIAIVLIFKKAKSLGNRKPEYCLKTPAILLYFLIAIFVLGAIFQIFNF